jgi:transcriptional regulator with XRE-family HTH domain
MRTAEFVRRARAKLNLTQAELAKALGLERRSIMRYEKGSPLQPHIRYAIKWLVARDKRLKFLARKRAARKPRIKIPGEP